MTIDKLLYDKASNSFETNIAFDGNKLSFTLFDFENTEAEKAGELANKIISWLKPNLEKAKAFAAKKLLKTKNEAWLEEDDEPISESDFTDSLDFEAITAFSEGNFEIYFDDGDLFWGHLVKVDVNADFSFEGADIVG